MQRQRVRLFQCNLLGKGSMGLLCESQTDDFSLRPLRRSEENSRLVPNELAKFKSDGLLAHRVPPR